MADFDCLIVLAIKAGNGFLSSPCYSDFADILVEHKSHDDSFDKEGGFILLPSSHKIRRLVYSPVGPVNRDQDDVRRFRDAAYKGVKRAIKAGSEKPIIIIPTIGNIATQYQFYDVATVLGVYEAIYTPIENRELFGPSRYLKFKHLSFVNFATEQREKDVFKLAEAIERGRNVARDIGGSDPERMSTINVVSYVKHIFAGSSIKLEVVEDLERIRREFPCLGIVDRGSLSRHSARIIFLSYEPPVGTPVDTTLCLVGKGVTYDTGGELLLKRDTWVTTFHFRSGCQGRRNHGRDASR